MQIIENIVSKLQSLKIEVAHTTSSYCDGLPYWMLTATEAEAIVPILASHCAKMDNCLVVIDEWTAFSGCPSRAQRVLIGIEEEIYTDIDSSYIAMEYIKVGDSINNNCIVSI